MTGLPMFHGVDRATLAAVGLLMLCGLVLLPVASPPIAERLDLPMLHFFLRQLAVMIGACALMVYLARQAPTTLLRLAAVLFVVTMLMMIWLLVDGEEINGARRWLRVSFVSAGSLSWQPSELFKPAFALVSAWAFLRLYERGSPRDMALCLALPVVSALLLLAQPDFGQAALLLGIWGAQFFVIGAPLAAFALFALLAAFTALTAYNLLPHVAARVDAFFSDAIPYQAARAMDAFAHGSWRGSGAGQGDLKHVLPDAHSDFILAVAAEEFGFLFCMLLLAAAAVIVLRQCARAIGDCWSSLAVVGLMTSFALQTLIHAASVMGLMPITGMPLPFVSYGGSSLLAMAITMGAALSLTRRPAAESSYA